MSEKTLQLWSKLQQAGIVTGDCPQDTHQSSPWYVKTLLGFSGWLASLFLLGFLGIGVNFIFDNEISSFIAGSLLIGAAFLVLRKQPHDFLEHMALAASLSGQVLIAWSIIKGHGFNETTTWAIYAAVQLFLALVMPNFVHRLLSSFIAGFAFFMSLTESGQPYIFINVLLLLATWLWLNEFRFPRQMQKIRAIGYGLVLALIPLKGASLFAYHSNELPQTSWNSDLLGAIIAAIILLYVVWQCLQRHSQALSQGTIVATLIGALILAVASFEVPGLTVGVIILLLGFNASNRILMGLGILSLLFYVSSYYYLLDSSLLQKSQSLFIAGAVFLVLRWVMLRLISTNKEIQNV